MSKLYFPDIPSSFEDGWVEKISASEWICTMNCPPGIQIIKPPCRAALIQHIKRYHGVYYEMVLRFSDDDKKLLDLASELSKNPEIAKKVFMSMVLQTH